MIYVFDLDGTLIDSKKRHWLLMKKILKKHNIKLLNNFAQSYMEYKADGSSGLTYLNEVMGLSHKVAKEIQSEWTEQIENDEWLKYDTLYDDAIPTIRRLKGDIRFLTIRENVQGLKNELNRFALSNFETIILSHKERKSNALKKMDKECIMIGDTEIDLYAANDLGCAYYILNRGFRSKRYWDAHGVKSYADLSLL